MRKPFWRNAVQPQRRSAVPMLEAFENRLLFATFTVNSTADTIDADPTVTTLREAILASNAASGADTINFNLTPPAGSTVATIFVQSALPAITGQVTIDGSTQPNPESVNHPRVQIDGSDLSAVPTDGLVVTGSASGSVIREIGVNRFTGFGIWLQGSSNNQLLGNFVGGSLDDNNALPNGTGVVITGDNNLVRGNLISGNIDANIEIAGATAFNNTVAGNRIGTDVTGLFAIGPVLNPPGQGVGVLIDNDATLNLIGGTAAADRNLISGNSAGVVFGVDAGGFNAVQGNYVGLAVNGVKAVPNLTEGIVVQSADERIGGGAAGAGNVVAGNGGTGIHLVEDTADRNVIQGNIIGLAADGTTVRPNGLDGVTLFSGASANTLANNVISGNNRYGIYLVENADKNVIQANVIGAKPDGTGGSAYGNAFHNILIERSSNNLIGGFALGQGNLIVNARNAGFDGVRVTSGRGNAIQANSIHDNAGLGIDLGPDGPTANDAGDPDTGANDLQNAPVLGFATSDSPGVTVVNGSLNSTPNSVFRIEFFSNPTNDGEGQTYLGAVSVTTNGAGDATFSVPVAASAGAFITATATNSLNSTSEFSNSTLAAATPAVSQVYVRSTAWTASFNSFLPTDTDIPGSTPNLGVAIPMTLPNQLAPQPFVNLNQVAVRFNQPVNFLTLGVNSALHGVTVPNYNIIASTQTNFADHSEIIFTLDRNIPADKLVLILTGVTSLNGNIPLDGNNDGLPGGDFRFRFNVLPGDVDRNTAVTGEPVVTATDFVKTRNHVGLSPSRPGTPPTSYHAFFDVNGDGVTNAIDLTAVRNRTGTTLPLGTPTLVASIFSSQRIEADESLASALTA